MTMTPEKRGRHDFDRGQSSPPPTYHSEEYRGAWQRGYDSAKAAFDRLQETQRAYDDERRHLPPAYRALHELQEAVGQESAEKIRALIEAMIQEPAE